LKRTTQESRAVAGKIASGCNCAKDKRLLQKGAEEIYKYDHMIKIRRVLWAID